MESEINDTVQQSQEEMDLRRGPWTMEEDLILTNYINSHGEGRWNTLARCAGLKRTGKSCRLRWLNYLRPDIRRGNITPEEQLLILQLHSRWGNRWSKIAQHLPGRTDNEIKNYWRTRVQKHAKQLHLWIPHLIERAYSPSGNGNLPLAEYDTATGGDRASCSGPGPACSGSPTGFSEPDGVQGDLLTQMGDEWWSEAYEQGMPELQQYWGGDCDANWNIEDIW